MAGKDEKTDVIAVYNRWFEIGVLGHYPQNPYLKIITIECWQLFFSVSPYNFTGVESRNFW